MRLVLLSLIILFSAFPASARLDSFVFECKKLPTLPMELIIPDVTQFNRTNNLRRTTGGAESSKGEPIVITGVISDKNCIPLEDAKVYIWQRDMNSKNPLEEADKDDVDPHFIGTGLTLTNNMGNYHFLTIEPGPRKKGMTPHINFYITHPLLKEGVYVPMFFPERDTNKTDPLYQGFSQPNQQILTSSLKEPLHKGFEKKKFKDDVYEFNIRLEVEQTKKVY